MASTVIASRNESSWGQSHGGLMGNSNLNPNPNSTNPTRITNHKHNSKSKKKKQFHALNDRHPTNGSPAVTQTGPDDAYSFNQRTIDTNRRNIDGFNHAVGGYVNIKVSNYSRTELNEVKRKLELELERVRILNDQIESKQFPPRSSHGKMKKILGQKRPLPAESAAPPPIQNQLENVVQNGNVDVLEILMKSCRLILMKLMKHKHSWVFNKPVDAVALGLHDYHLIVKRPMDLGTVKLNFAKNLYPSPVDFALDVRLTFNNAMLYNPKTDEVHRMAAQLLSEFETKFGPIQDKLDEISSQKEQSGFVNDELQGSSWNDISVPHFPPRPEKPKTSLHSLPKPKKPKTNLHSPPRPKNPKTNLMNPIPRKPEWIPEPVQKQNQSSATNPSNSNPGSGQSPVSTPSPVKAQPVKPAKPAGPVKAASTMKLPKPRAKDPNKREMSMEEKQRLGVGLQSLPQEKMPQLVQIIRKRNDQLSQEGDEIELDIEALDTETLWELDRFVTNWKKLVSKTKRQALMENYSAAPTVTSDTDETPVSNRNDEDGVARKIKIGDGEEDVDIGDEIPVNSFPPVEIEKDDGGHGQENGIRNGNASCSSSSSGSSNSDSSSSDSDSGSSSGSDSDANEVQS